MIREGICRGGPLEGDTLRNTFDRPGVLLSEPYNTRIAFSWDKTGYYRFVDNGWLWVPVDPAQWASMDRDVEAAAERRDLP